jgi:hypothetical protein
MFFLSPLQLRAQIKCPLELVKAAAWFLEQQSPLNRKRSWIALPPPLGHMLAAFSPHVPVQLRRECMPATGHCSCQHARDIQDDVALGPVCDGARDAGSRAQSAGAAASGLVLVLFPRVSDACCSKRWMIFRFASPR